MIRATGLLKISVGALYEFHALTAVTTLCESVVRDVSRTTGSKLTVVPEHLQYNVRILTSENSAVHNSVY